MTGMQGISRPPRRNDPRILSKMSGPPISTTNYSLSLPYQDYKLHQRTAYSTNA